MIKRVKKFAINTLALVILLSQVTGCACTYQDETIFETGTTDNSELVESTENEVEQTEEVGESFGLDVEQEDEVIDISKGYSLSDEEKEIIEDAIKLLELSSKDAEDLEYFATTRAEDGFNVKDTIDEIVRGYEEEKAEQQKPVETQAPDKPTQPKPTQPKPTQPKPTQDPDKPTQPKPTQPKPTQPKPVETEPAEREYTEEEIQALRKEAGLDSGNAYIDMTPEEEQAAKDAWSNFK